MRILIIVAFAATMALTALRAEEPTTADAAKEMATCINEKRGYAHCHSYVMRFAKLMVYHAGNAAALIAVLCAEEDNFPIGECANMAVDEVISSIFDDMLPEGNTND